MSHLKQITKRVLKRFGYEIRGLNGEKHKFQKAGIESLNYEIPPELMSTIAEFTMLSRIRLQSLANAALHVARNGVRGDIVQCGVWRGGSAALMAHVVQASGGPLRAFHLFDSFEGIPEPDAKIDGPRALREARKFGMATEGRLVPNPQVYLNMGRPVGYIEDAQGLLEDVIGYDPDLLLYHKGMFEHVIPSVHEQIESISLLHLDGDLYSSTKVCLDFLYDRVVFGGLVIIDDYGAYDGCRRAVDEFFERMDIHPYLHQLDTEVVLFEKS